MSAIGFPAALDAVGEVVNTPPTYAAIAAALREDRCALIGWTDNAGSHLDILFTLGPLQCGNNNLGLIGANCLFVSVLGRGCQAFGFDVSSPRAPRAPVYVAEKLFGREPDETSIAVTELLNGVVAALFGDAA
jgi:hypothetical protein